MGSFIHLLHTLQGTLGDNMEGKFLVNSKGDFIIDHNNNFIELYEKCPEPPPPPMGDPHVSVIGDIGTDSSSYVPTYNGYCYSLTQQIYTAAEIDFEGYITGIVFYPRGDCNNRVFSVFLSPISNTSFTDYNSVVVSQDDIVLTSKTVTVAADTPIWLQFDTPYYYAGDENLLVTVKDDTGSYDSSIYFDIMYTGNLYQALYVYTDSAPYNPSTQNGMYQLTYKNAIQLLFNNAEPEEPTPDLPTENYFMLTNRGNDTNIEINSANSGNVFINDVYAGKTGNTYSISAGAVIKITNLRATGSYEHSSIYTTDANANLSVDRWDESIAGDPSYVFSGQSGIRSVNSWNGAQNYTGLSYTFYRSTVETVNNWSNLTYLNKMDRTFIASQLRSIPSSWYGLHGVHILNYAFSDTKLTSLPTSWDGLNNAESMRSTFFNCTLIQSGGTQDIESLWQVTDTDSCFGHCSSWAVDIEPMYTYLKNKSITVTSHANMFYECTSASNRNQVPVSWGGDYQEPGSYFMLKVEETADSISGQTSQSQGYMQISQLELYTGSNGSGTKLSLTHLYNSGHNSGDGSPANLFDTSTSTKWCTSFNSYKPAWVIFKSSTSAAPLSYKMATGNDTNRWGNRNPITWKLYLSSVETSDPNSSNWTLIDSRTNDTTMGAYSERYYTFNIS